MYYLQKRLEIAGSHKLDLDYESKCQNIHGHNWIITVYCKSKTLNKNGMIIDFTDIKKAVMKFDHQHINDHLKCNPTAENMAEHLVNTIPFCYKADVQESEGNIASYEIQG